MFVLQECSICFEDYDSERQPHSIPCGHVFCQPCLESLVSTSPQCPNCRVSYASASIRKVICTLQEQESRSTAQQAEAETLMWQAIQSAIESPDDLKQRKSIIHNNPHDALLAAGMSKNVLTALAMMGYLVQVEEKNGSLKDRLNTAWAVEESLRDQISHLEAKLNLAGTNTCPSSEHFKREPFPLSRSINQDDNHPQLLIKSGLLADVQKLQSVVDVINKNTSEFSRQLNARPEPSTEQVRSIEPPTSQARLVDNSGRKTPAPMPPPTPIPVPEPVPTPFLKKQPSRPGILRKSLPQDMSSSIVNSPVESPTTSRAQPRQDAFGPTHHRYPSTPTPTRQLMSPPMTPSVLPEQLDGPSLFGQMPQANRWQANNPPPSYSGPGIPSTEQAPRPQSPPAVTRHLSIASVSTPQRTHMAHLSMPTPSVLPNTTNPTFVQPRPPPTPTPTQPSSYRSINDTPLPTPIPAPTPTPKPPTPTRTLTAVFDFSGKSANEHSLRNGQKLYLLPESDTNQDWIWCRDENGKTGYAPKSYIKVDST